MVRQLGSCAWIGEHLNVLITGATGVGKSYLASALGQAACRKGLRVMYRRVPRLFDELALARVDGSYARVLSRLAKAELLRAICDMLNCPMPPLIAGQSVSPQFEAAVPGEKAGDAWP